MLVQASDRLSSGGSIVLPAQLRDVLTHHLLQA